MVKLSPSSEDVRVYEIAVMYQPDLQQSAEAEFTKELEAIFSDSGAKLLFKDPWTKRGLAYKIKGYQEAKFTIYYYEADPAKMRDVDHAIRLQKNVLRHLIVIPPNDYEAVSCEEQYQYWLKNRVTIKEQRVRDKEEKLKQGVVERARRETKRTQEKAKATPRKAMPIGDISERLDKLISDEDISI